MEVTNTDPPEKVWEMRLQQDDSNWGHLPRGPVAEPLSVARQRFAESGLIRIAIAAQGILLRDASADVG